ncbi:MAG: hypothetical protein FWC64_13335 [Treponema sp.]|nr:hypothetical protein [Treponema sp.]
MKKMLTAILAGLIAAAGLYAQTASFDEGHWIAPAPVLSATPLPSLFFPDDATFDNAAQPMQEEAAAEWQPSMFSVGFNFTLLSSFRGFSNVIERETVQERTTITEHTFLHWGIFGIGAFFDARYVELSIGLSIGLHAQDEYRYRDGRRYNEDSSRLWPSLAFDFSLLFKFPLELPFGGYVFPLLGVGYTIVPFPARTATRIFSHFSTVHIPFGVGWDVPIGSTMFIRSSLLLSYTFASSSNASHEFPWGISLLFGIGFGL